MTTPAPQTPPGQPEFRHLIVTLFNVKRGGMDVNTRGTTTRTEEWMKRRLEIFEWLCLPSLRGQSNLNFRWLVFFDRQTPEIFRTRIAGYREFSNFEPVFVDDETQVVAEVTARVPVGIDWLISTRLDSDDAFCRTAVEVIQKTFRPQGNLVLNLLTGYGLAGRRIYLFERPSNSSATLIEKRSEKGFFTACRCPHPDFEKYFPLVNLKDRRYWIQGLHDQNQSSIIWRDQPGYWRWRVRLAARNALVRLKLWPGQIISAPLEKPTGLSLEDLEADFALGPRPQPGADRD